MTCAHCCGAESIFDEKEAQKNLKKYLKKGANKTTQKLLNVLKKEELVNLSLLDIGGGIGVIQQELLKEGISNTTDIDSSIAYINIAKDLMVKNGYQDRMKFIHGDFNDYADQIPPHDIVTLEKVVCCYPYVKDLLNNSLSKTKKYYALVYPMDSIASKIVNAIGHLYLRIISNPFRTYIHSEKMMHELIEKNGFKKMYYGKKFPWRIVVYKKHSKN